MVVSAALTLRPVCAANAAAVIKLPLHAAQCAHAGFVETGLDGDGEMMAERLLS